MYIDSNWPSHQIIRIHQPRASVTIQFAMKFSAVTALAGLATATAAVEGTWNYDHPELWQDNFPACNSNDDSYGMGDWPNYQSPINLEVGPFTPRPAESRPLTFMVGENGCTEATFETSDHGVKVGFGEGCMNSKVMFGEKEYTLAQFHVHAKSENTFNGRQADAELHMVHTRTNDMGETEYLVAGVMLGVEDYTTGGGTNSVKFINKLLDTGFDNEEHEFIRGINAYEYLIPENKEFACFIGSFTTPPCTSGVTWILFEDLARISRSSLDKMQEMWVNHPDSIADKNGENYRPVQDLKDRGITYGQAEFAAMGLEGGEECMADEECKSNFCYCKKSKKRSRNPLFSSEMPECFCAGEM